MFKNYLIISFRNLWRNRLFSAVNVVGLAIGMATCLLIFQYVSFEFGFDKFHQNYKNTYRVINTRSQNGVKIQEGPITYPTVGPAMATEFSEIEVHTRMMPMFSVYLRTENEVFRVDNAHFVDKNFLSVLDYPVVVGDRKSALSQPNTLMMSEEFASRVFKDKSLTDLVGDFVRINNFENPFMITGFFKRPPSNSHLEFNMLLSYETMINATEGAADSSWVWSDFRHYLVLNPNVNLQRFQNKFDSFSDKYFKGNKVSGSDEKFFLQPLEQVRFNPTFEYDIARTTNGKVVWTLAFVASFILILAWINYINLTTSKAMERAKEVGIRKVLGGFRSQLITQFLTESIIINFFGLFFAITIVQILQPYFNELVGIDLSILGLFSDNVNQSFLFFVIISFFLFGIMLTAFYPAFILSGYKPAVVLKGKFHNTGKSNILKKVLVIVQFVASVALITGSMVVFRQLDFIQNKKIGISIDNTMVIMGPQLSAFDTTFINNTISFKTALKEMAMVEDASTSSRVPGQRLGRNFNLKRKTGGDDKSYTVSVNYVDHDFLDQYGVKLLAGRNFLPNDHNIDFEALDKIVINSATVEMLGFENVEASINQNVFFGNSEWTIVGVVNDFHQESIHRQLEPMTFFPTYNAGNYISVKLNDAYNQQNIQAIEAAYTEFFPGNSFDYFFLEERYKSQYASEFRFNNVLQFFTTLAILIACFGLFGLSTHTISQRSKEIGIRKVMGASIQNIVVFLSGYYLQLIFIAGIIAVPLGYLATGKWLNNYAYKVNIPWWVFVIPIIVIVFIAFLTIIIQTLKAANRNPIKALRQD